MIKLQTVGGGIHWNNTKIIDSMLQMILWADIGFARKKGKLFIIIEMNDILTLNDVNRDYLSGNSF